MLAAGVHEEGSSVAAAARPHVDGLNPVLKPVPDSAESCINQVGSCCLRDA